MSIVFSYLVVPIILLMIIINVFLRLKIIKIYKELRDQNIEIEPGIIFNRERSEAYIAQNYPEHTNQVRALTTNLRRLLLFGLMGLIIIVSIFVYVYLNNPQ